MFRIIYIIFIIQIFLCMKKLLILPLLILHFYSFGQSRIIGIPTKISGMEVAQFDFPSSMTRSKAIIACRELGFGWELPTKIQLDSLYKNKIIIGGFNNDIYWSSSLNDNGKGWSQNFSNGNKGLSDDEVLGYVRAVKEIDEDLSFLLDQSDSFTQESGETVKQFKWNNGKPFASTDLDNRYYSDKELVELNKPANIIGSPIKVGKLLVAQREFSGKYIWKNAKAICATLGPGWRLPTKDELYFLYLNKNKIGNFSIYAYWSSSESNQEGVAWHQDFYLGGTKPSIANKNSPWGVRAVKSQ